MSPRADNQGTAARMRAVAAELAAVGLDTRLHDTWGVLDVTARLDRPGAKAVEVIVDDDGYIQVSYWSPPDAAPARVTAAIAAVLATITSGISADSPADRSQAEPGDGQAAGPGSIVIPSQRPASEPGGWAMPPPGG